MIASASLYLVCLPCILKCTCVLDCKRLAKARQPDATVLCVLQTVIARETDPLHSQVVSMTRFNTGENAYNVIPDVVKLGATYRSLTHEGMVRMKKRMYEVCLQLQSTNTQSVGVVPTTYLCSALG